MEFLSIMCFHANPGIKVYLKQLLTISQQIPHINAIVLDINPIVNMFLSGDINLSIARVWHKTTTFNLFEKITCFTFAFGA